MLQAHGLAPRSARPVCFNRHSVGIDKRLIQWHGGPQRCSGSGAPTLRPLRAAAAPRRPAQQTPVGAASAAAPAAPGALDPGTTGTADAAGEADGELGARVLERLWLYAPRPRGGGVFGDSPASLGRLLPYRSQEVEAALRYGEGVLPTLSLRQMAGIASALAAAGHVDAAFMAAMAEAAGARLREAPGDGAPEWGPVCHLALAYARLGIHHPGLMQAVAASGARSGREGGPHTGNAGRAFPSVADRAASCIALQRASFQARALVWTLIFAPCDPPAPPRPPATWMLECGDVKMGMRRRASQFTALLASFAALRLRPPRLLAAAGEALKRTERPSLLKHLGPWECVVLVWALGRLSSRGIGQGEVGEDPQGPASPAASVAATASAGGSGVLAVTAYAASWQNALARGDTTAWALVLERATTLVGEAGAGMRPGSPAYGNRA
jgi:hypothetical protein